MINVINNGIANGIPRPNGIRYSTIIMLAIDIKILETICIIEPKVAINV